MLLRLSRLLLHNENQIKCFLPKFTFCRVWWKNEVSKQKGQWEKKTGQVKSKHVKELSGLKFPHGRKKFFSTEFKATTNNCFDIVFCENKLLCKFDNVKFWSLSHPKLIRLETISVSQSINVAIQMEIRVTFQLAHNFLHLIYLIVMMLYLLLAAAELHNNDSLHILTCFLNVEKPKFIQLVLVVCRIQKPHNTSIKTKSQTQCFST